MAASSSVRVAVRVRPLTENEKQHEHHSAIKFIPNNEQQIVVGGDRSFTFDYVYPPAADQEQVYSTCVIPLLNKFVEGYNSTILAYGQTGSGKTYSMGIGLDSVMNATNEGIVPRFIDSLFQQLNANKSPNYSFQLCVSFLELHNEDLVDLLSPSAAVKRKAGHEQNNVCNLTIREDSQGNICWSGVKEEHVSSPNELLGFLQKGSLARTTASTDMNNTSSRSHAIFSVILRQQYTPSSSSDNLELQQSPSDQTLVDIPSSQMKRLVSKFHFVDLAGSERLKRTNAVGDRAKEGISINAGLLALGNVISALGDESRRVSHIPYRDSKLTRLLQDSLGGNCQCLMLACASPANSNLTETLNTLKYANRARNIRNRVVINQEMDETDHLKATITRLKEELRGNDDFLCAVNDEMDSLKAQVCALHQTLTQTTDELAIAKYDRDLHQRNANENETVVDYNTTIIQEYAKTIESLRAELALLKQQQQIYPATASLFNNNKKLKVDHEDSSATLVASPTQSANNFDHLLIEARKNKKKGLRSSLKRVKSKRSSMIPSPQSATPPKMIKPFVDTSHQILTEAKKSIQSETDFLQSAQVYIAANPYATKVNNGLQRHTSLQYRRRTVDISSPITMGATLQTDQLNENKRLLQKLTNVIESKHQMVSQLEKSEKLRKDQVQQLNRKIAEMTSKKTTSTAQFKRELSECRNGYESRIKKQQAEIQTLRRNHVQLINKTEGARNQSQSVMDQLNRNIEKLTHEKKKLIKRLKMESDRSKEKQGEVERELLKMKRQENQLVTGKKRLERELLQQKLVSKRATEEIVALSGQMKQVGTIIKKVMMNMTSKIRMNNAITDKNLLAKAAACANVRGYLVKQSAIKRSGAGKFKVSSLQQHVFQKKRLIHRAITLHVNGQSTNRIEEELIQKRDRLMQEQQELLAERQLVLQEESEIHNTIDSQPQYMDERIDLITIKLDTLNQQINRLASEKNKYEDDDDNWMDIVDKELHIGISDNTDSQVAYETALSLIRSLEPEEARIVSEAFMEDIIKLKAEEQYNSTSIRHLSSMLNSLQLGLVQMRRAGNYNRFAEGCSSDEEDDDEEAKTPSDTVTHVSKSTNSASVLDSLFMKVLQSSVDIKCGLVLPK